MIEIKVGDRVRKIFANGELSGIRYNVLYIHNKDPDRKWYVISYDGDIPTAHFGKDLRKEPVVIKRNGCVSSDGRLVDFTVEEVDGVINWSTVKEKQ